MKTYLGDSVYAEIEHGMIKLTTDNGYDSGRNTIYLEPEVFIALRSFALRHLNFESLPDLPQDLP